MSAPLVAVWKWLVANLQVGKLRKVAAGRKLLVLAFLDQNYRLK
jgi:hypothetical protein